MAAPPNATKHCFPWLQPQPPPSSMSCPLASASVVNSLVSPRQLQHFQRPRECHKPATISHLRHLALTPRKPPTMLPSFNFIETKPKTKQPTSPLHSYQAPKLPGFPLGNAANTSANQTQSALSADFEFIFYSTIEKWAAKLQDDALPLESKMARLWHAVLRHAAHSLPQDEDNPTPSKTSVPNAICTAVCLEILQQILQLIGLSSMLLKTLFDGICHSIYFNFDPRSELVENQQYADLLLTRELDDQQSLSLRRDAGQNDQIIAAIAGFDEATRESRIVKIMTPFMTEEMLQALWNTTATSLASRSMPSINGSSTDPTGATTPSEDARRERATLLANRVLQERVRLVQVLWDMLSSEETVTASRSMRVRYASSAKLLTSAGGAAGGAADEPISSAQVIKELEDTFLAAEEQQQQQSSLRRKGSDLSKSDSVRSISPSGSFDIETPVSSQVSEQLSQVLNNQTRKAMSARNVLETNSHIKGFGSATRDTSFSAPFSPFSSGAGGSLAAKGIAHRGNTTSEPPTVPASLERINTLQRHPSILEMDILHELRDIFDFVCEDKTRRASTRGPGPLGHVRSRLRDLLTCHLVEEKDAIDAKFNRSDGDQQREGIIEEEDEYDLDGINSSVTAETAIIQQFKKKTELLVSIINQAPEVLLQAIQQNQGILRFAICKNTLLVKRFLKLDPKACENLDLLARKSQGFELLWGTNSSLIQRMLQIDAASVGKLMGSSGSAKSLHENEEDSTLSSSASGITVPALARAPSIAKLSNMVNASFRMSKMMLTSAASSRNLQLNSETSATGSGAALLEQFVVSHYLELAQLMLDKPKYLRQLFEHMEAQTDSSSLLRVTLVLQDTKCLQQFLQRLAMEKLERITEMDVPTIRDLLSQVLKMDGEAMNMIKQMPTLMLTMAGFNPTAMANIVNADPENFKQYAVLVASKDDDVLLESLMNRTREMRGFEDLMECFRAVITGSFNNKMHFSSGGGRGTAHQRATVKRRLFRAESEHRSLFHTLTWTLIAASELYHPSRFFLYSQYRHNFKQRPMWTEATNKLSNASGGSATLASGSATIITSAAAGHSSKAHAKQASRHGPKQDISNPAANKRRGPNSSGKSPPQRQTIDREDSDLDLEPLGKDGAGPMTPPVKASRDKYTPKLPPIWLSFVTFCKNKYPEKDVLVLPKSQLKGLILDILIEFIKIDESGIENDCLLTLPPYVCDYFMNRYNDRALVGFWLLSLFEGLVLHIKDLRVNFFASACGISPTPLAFELVVCYLQALDHIIYGQMQLYKPDNRMEELPDGMFALRRQSVLAASTSLFNFTLEKDQLRALQNQIQSLRSFKLPYLPLKGKDDELVELDDVMALFIDQWQNLELEVDDKYREAFMQHVTTSSGNELAGAQFIDMDAFVKIVQQVTKGNMSARACRMVFYDFGSEYLDVETLVHVSHAYHLRVVPLVPPVMIPQQDKELYIDNSLGKLNVSCVEREIEDLQQYWKRIRGEIDEQLVSQHQTESIKRRLAEQKAAIEDRLEEVTKAKLVYPALLSKTWEEMQACARIVNSAKLTQRCLTAAFLQLRLSKWIRQVRERRDTELG